MHNFINFLFFRLKRIRILFSISDINNASPEGFLPEDDMVEAENEEDEEAVSFPVRASVTIEKVIVLVVNMSSIFY